MVSVFLKAQIHGHGINTRHFIQLIHLNLHIFPFVPIADFFFRGYKGLAYRRMTMIYIAKIRQRRPDFLNRSIDFNSSFECY